jgi:F-box and WD-40 domain protein CDC4
VRLVGHSGTVRSVKALSANRAISGSKDGTVRLWNIERGGCEALFEGHSATIRSLAFHGDLAVSASYDNDARVWRLAFHGDLAVSASYDNDARVWRLEEKKCSHVLKGHESSLYAVAFDGQRIVTGSLDRTARIWDPTTG